MNRIALSAVFVLPLAAAITAPAAVIDGFYLGGDASVALVSVAPTTVDPSISADVLSRGTVIGAGALAHAFASTAWPIGTTAPTTFAAAAAADDYFQFALTVQPGDQLSLTTINSDMRRSSNAAAGNFQYAYSFDGFNADSEVAGSFVDALNAGLTANVNGEVEPSIDLSQDADLQNIAAGTTVTFRLYGYGATTTTSTVSFGRLAYENGAPANDLEIDGTAAPAAVPEPASLAGIVIAGAALLGRRRRLA